MTEQPARRIRRASPDETALLNELTRRSVLHWGYEPAFLDWEPEAITLSEEFVTGSPVYVLEEGNRLIGYYALLQREDELTLDKLFVEPDRIGTGCGRLLWDHALGTARLLGATRLTLASDPNAAPFYRTMGARWTHEVETTWPGWSLQFFHVDLASPGDVAP